ncbi:MAG TPA: AAA family ATPase [Vicinamibacterales bacterium]
MRAAPDGSLPAVRIEPENEWAWCGTRRLDLTPRVFAVLRHLVERHQKLVTKQEMLTAVWGATAVSDAALTSCVRDLRQALRDSSRTPKYIETVHRRGFRFIGPVATESVPVVAPPAAPAHAGAPRLVGRDAELALLHSRFANARDRRRQMLFVTGEPGLGKTTLVEAFLSQIGTGTIRIGRGQCVEQYGAGEAYMPVLEALGRLGRSADGGQLIHILKQDAPTWLAQLPALLTDEELDAVQRRAQSAMRDRMLRELVEAFDRIASDVPLVLVLEDLHWSDSATIDLLTMVARRREPAQLMVIATYRPGDLAISDHPLRSAKRELQLHGFCEELALDFLSAPAIADYLAQRFPSHQFPPDLVAELHRISDGNPLFLTTFIDDLVARGQIQVVDERWTLSGTVANIALDTPDTLSQLVESQVERLTQDEQMLLAVASVAGADFSTAVATAGAIESSTAEHMCEALARRGQFLRAAGSMEWPDGTVAGRYGFIHALYCNALYSRVSMANRIGWHLRIAERLEAGFGQRAEEIAGELAMHFERGGDLERAITYRIHAGEHALRQHAYREAAEHAAHGLELLHKLPESLEARQRELTLQVTLASALTVLKGYADAAVEAAYARARELCLSIGGTSQLFPILIGLCRFYLVRASFEPARDVAAQMIVIGRTARDAAIDLAADNALGMASFYQGRFEDALVHFDRAIERYDPAMHSPVTSPAFRGGQDLGMSSRVHTAFADWMLGFPDRGVQRMQDALTQVKTLGHPFSTAYAGHFAAAFHMDRREHAAVRSLEEAVGPLSQENGFVWFLLMAKTHRAWVSADLEGDERALLQLNEAIVFASTIGARIRLPAYLGAIAAVHGHFERATKGLALVADTIAANAESGQRFWDAELHRIEGALLLQADGVDSTLSAAAAAAAESRFHTAIRIAREQKARILELRASVSLSRLWDRQGKSRDAHGLLSAIYGGFTEGFNTPDLLEAKSLLDRLNGSS